jgi:hypothetical protein
VIVPPRDGEIGTAGFGIPAGMPIAAVSERAICLPEVTIHEGKIHIRHVQAEVGDCNHVSSVQFHAQAYPPERKKKRNLHRDNPFTCHVI